MNRFELDGFHQKLSIFFESKMAAFVKFQPLYFDGYDFLSFEWNSHENVLRPFKYSMSLKLITSCARWSTVVANLTSCRSFKLIDYLPLPCLLSFSKTAA